MMHKPPEECHKFTTIGLVFEGLYALAGPILFLMMVLRISDFFMPTFPQGFSSIVSVILVFSGSILLVFPVIFIVNMILFKKLLNQHYNITTAESIYLYQIIYGIIALFSVFALLPGIFYLLSGIHGRMSIRGNLF